MQLENAQKDFATQLGNRDFSWSSSNPHRLNDVNHKLCLLVSSLQSLATIFRIV